MKERYAAITLSFLLALTLIGVQLARLGKANFTPLPELPPPIYIRSDGSIEPPSVGIQAVGDTYTFTGDINSSIQVERDNILIDGNGFSLTQTPINTTGLMIPAGWYPSISLTNRNNVTLENLKIRDCISGMAIQSSSNITVTESSITSVIGIAIFSSSSRNCTIIQNDITSNNQGILIIDSMHINIYENNIAQNSIGVQCYSYTAPPKLDAAVITSGCAYVNLFGNNIVGNSKSGISLRGSFFTRIEYNTLANNNIGIGLFPSYHTIVYHNNFKSNSENADSGGPLGGYLWTFDDGSEGNYWSDYLTKYPNTTEIGHSGVGNTPYVINTVNMDHFPLMREASIQPPYRILEFPLPSSSPNSSDSSPSPVDFIAPSITILFPEPRTYNSSEVLLDFYVSEYALQIEYSLDGKTNVTVNGNTTLTALANGGHNLTVYAKDEAGNIGVSETVHFRVEVPEVAEPFPIAVAVIVSGVAIAAVAAGVLVYWKKRKRQGTPSVSNA